MANIPPHRDPSRQVSTSHQVRDVLKLLGKLTLATDFEQTHCDKIQAAVGLLPKPLSAEAAEELRAKQVPERQMGDIHLADSDDAQLLPKPEYSTPSLKHRHNDLAYLMGLCGIILLYIFLSGMLFMALESNQGWSAIDGWYFAVVTIGTVGYGVLTPSHDMTRLFVVVYLMGGMVFFLFVMSILCNYLLDRLEVFTKANKYHNSVCGPRVIGLMSFLILIIFTGTFYGMVFEEWNLIESLYFTVVTITTVGYGDYTTTSQFGRLIISFYILLAGGCFTAIVGGTIASYITIRQRAAALLFMMGPLLSHWFGDDWTLPMDSNVGPTGIVPATVVTALLSVRLVVLTSLGNKQKTK